MVSGVLVASQRVQLAPGVTGLLQTRARVDWLHFTILVKCVCVSVCDKRTTCICVLFVCVCISAERQGVLTTLPTNLVWTVSPDYYGMVS